MAIDWNSPTKKKMGRAKSVKQYCKEQCCAGDLQSWKECPMKGCFLWKFRLGKEISTSDKSNHKTVDFNGKSSEINDSTKNRGVENDN